MSSAYSPITKKIVPSELESGTLPSSIMKSASTPSLTVELDSSASNEMRFKSPLFLDEIGKEIEEKARMTGSSPLPIQLPGDNNQYIVEMSSFDYGEKKDEVVTLVHRSKDYKEGDIPFVRVHSACMTGEVFHSLACDCRYQFDYAMKTICQKNYGIMIYMVSHEGRGVGIGNKIKIYNLQQGGKNILTANDMLGLPFDIRDFRAAASVLKDQFGIFKVKLITNNPSKIQFLQSRQIEVVETLNVPAPVNKYNQSYLLTKKIQLSHNFKDITTILFYDAEEQPYGFLSNFFHKTQDPSFCLCIGGQEWPSVEHYYQASKFYSKEFTTMSPVNEAAAAWYSEKIRLAPSPAFAKMLGRMSHTPEGSGVDQDLVDDVSIADFLSITNELNEKGVSAQQLFRSDWPSVKDEVMKFAVTEKFRQNPHLMKKLKDTESANLVEASAVDGYWGSGADGNGLNKLGKMLIDIRNSFTMN